MRIRFCAKPGLSAILVEFQLQSSFKSFRRYLAKLFGVDDAHRC